jgi:beta-N-acetylhexosaminidase
MKDFDRLTLEEKVGQLFFLGFPGYSPDRESQAILDVVRPGGIILFQRNIESFDQIYELNARLQDRFDIPLLTGIDQEGGAVDRLKQIFGPLPSIAELSAGGTSQVRMAAKIIASELESTGFNLDFAPVLDLGLPDSIVRQRTFSENPTDVARLATAFTEELGRKKILACAKHFPGLGAAQFDPHFVLPRIDRPKRQMLQEDVLPFLSLIDAVSMIMVGHAHYPGFGDERPTPASLSSRIVDGFLRKKLGFEGVIITDDLTMGAIAGLGLTPDLFLAAFEAGNDMLMFSQATPLVERAFQNLVKRARASTALRARVDQSVERILTAKARISPLPIRYRTHMKARVSRQIEKLRKTVGITARAATV